jgi:hypothetical protein
MPGPPSSQPKRVCSDRPAAEHRAEASRLGVLPPPVAECLCVRRLHRFTIVSN